MHRRSFIEMFIAGTAGFTGMPKFALQPNEERKWAEVKRQFPDAKSAVLNFNNGSAGMIPTVVEAQLSKLQHMMNTMAPYEALETWAEIIRESRMALAKLVGVHHKELALVRNTTEALMYALKGIDIPKNSKVICAKHDYGHAVNILKRLSEEKTFNLVELSIHLPASKKEIIDAYDELIDEDCSVVLLTAMTHREGQILPIKEITKIAQSRGAKVVVDAAHALGHFDHSISDWGCDYYCGSLHKWLSCPIGAGILFVKKELIAKTKGSYSADKMLDGKMKKFEDVGTKPFAVEASILTALNFQNEIGFKAKARRLKSLTDYWTKEMKNLPGIRTFKPQKYGAISAFRVDGPSTKVLSHLSKNKIHLKKVSAKYYPEGAITRYRVSPNIYHDFNDLDRLIEAMKSYRL